MMQHLRICNFCSALLSDATLRHTYCIEQRLHTTLVDHLSAGSACARLQDILLVRHDIPYSKERRKSAQSQLRMPQLQGRDDSNNALHDFLTRQPREELFVIC